MMNNLDFPNGILIPKSCAVSAPSTSAPLLTGSPPAESALKSPAIKATAAPSLDEVFRSSRVRAWVPQHLIDSLYAKKVK
jgi:hypothetical protein